MWDLCENFWTMTIWRSSRYELSNWILLDLSKMHFLCHKVQIELICRHIFETACLCLFLLGGCAKMTKLFEFDLLTKLSVGVPFFIQVFTKRGQRLSSQSLAWLNFYRISGLNSNLLFKFVLNKSSNFVRHHNFVYLCMFICRCAFWYFIGPHHSVCCLSA